MTPLTSHMTPLTSHRDGRWWKSSKNPQLFPRFFSVLPLYFPLNVQARKYVMRSYLYPQDIQPVSLDSNETLGQFTVDPSLDRWSFLRHNKGVWFHHVFIGQASVFKPPGWSAKALVSAP